MTDHYDVIIVGLGAMGSAALRSLSKRNLSVLGLDMFEPPHAMGSSYGATRVIREAYFEDPAYVPLLKRSYELWRDFESETGEEFFLQTGGLMMGRPDSTIVSGAKASADAHNLSYEWLQAESIREQYAPFNISDDTVAVLEPRAGILYPEKCIENFFNRSHMQGAEIRTNERILEWKAHSSGFEVRSSQGLYSADQLILSAGPWMSELLRELKPSLSTDRQLLFWFDVAESPEQYQPDQFPIFIWEYDKEKYIYGFPDLGDGLKVAKHYAGTSCDPNEIDREVHQHEIEEMHSIVEQHLPSAAGSYRSSAVCMYTNTPDYHFILDEHPEHPNLWVVSPCSGHGFKFAVLIGELLADFVQEKAVGFDLSLFNFGRLS